MTRAIATPQSLFDRVPETTASAEPVPTPSIITGAAIVRQEANLLRFPFFALGRKGLRNHKGLLIRGQSRLDSQAYDFEYRITCNSDDLYPGQLARKVHMGLLTILQQRQSLPYANPIEFTWRQLMETIGVTASGRTQQQLKQAIRSIEGTRIRSKFALKNAHGKHLKGRERGYGLYSEYVFFDELMPDDQTVANKNFVWLADWYLANINSLYCSPLDHALWRQLDEASPIASRMYEFFTFNFAGDWQSLTIDYDKLSRFLPVAPEKYLSQIKKQLDKSLRYVTEAGVLSDAQWKLGKHAQPQLVVTRGRLLSKRGPRDRTTAPADDLEATRVETLYRQARPEDELVCQFYALWDGSDQYQPTPTDRARATQVIATYGQARAEQLLPAVVELVRQHFSQAKTFGATSRYWADAAHQLDRTQRVAERRKQEFLEEQLGAQRHRQEQAKTAHLEQQWDALSRAEQQSIRQHVLQSHPASMRLEKFDRILHRFCLKELANRRPK